MTPEDAYRNCAEFHYAADYISHSAGISVVYVVGRDSFKGALPTAERMEALKEKLISMNSKGGADPNEVSDLMEEWKELVGEFASKVGVPESVLLGVK